MTDKLLDVEPLPPKRRGRKPLPRPGAGPDGALCGDCKHFEPFGRVRGWCLMQANGHIYVAPRGVVRWDHASCTKFDADPHPIRPCTGCGWVTVERCRGCGTHICFDCDHACGEPQTA
jgi:hypothetical protein